MGIYLEDDKSSDPKVIKQSRNYKIGLKLEAHFEKDLYNKKMRRKVEAPKSSHNKLIFRYKRWLNGYDFRHFRKERTQFQITEEGIGLVKRMVNPTPPEEIYSDIFIKSLFTCC